MADDEDIEKDANPEEVEDASNTSGTDNTPPEEENPLEALLREAREGRETKEPSEAEENEPDGSLGAEAIEALLKEAQNETSEPSPPDEDQAMDADSIANLLNEAQDSGDDDSVDADEIANLLKAAQNDESGEDNGSELPESDASEVLGASDIENLLREAQGNAASREAKKEETSEDDVLGRYEEEEDFLDQGAIDALMSGDESTTEHVIFRFNGRRFTTDDNVVVEDYDFTNPVFMSEAEMRQIRIRHEQFNHHLGARLSMALRMDFGLKLAKLNTTQYEKYKDSIPNPTHITLFRLEQFSGIGVVDINPRLAMTIIDRLLGGAGHSIRNERYLTELESVMMDDVVNIMLEEWCRQWKDLMEINPTLIGKESSGRFLQTSPRDAIMLVVCLEATLGDCCEMIQIGIPYHTIEPIVKKLHDQLRHTDSSDTVKKRPHWSPLYSKIKVPVFAEWDAFECTIADLLNFRPGDVIELDRGMLEKTFVKMNNRSHYRGRMGVHNGHSAVEILEKLNPFEEQ